MLSSIRAGDIVLIKHRNMDEVICCDLIIRKVRAVLNMDSIMTGDYPNPGPMKMLESRILLIEEISWKIWEVVQDGDIIRISGNRIYLGGSLLGRGRVLGKKELIKRYEAGKKKYKKQLTSFLDNTLKRAMQEKELFLDIVPPKIKTSLYKKAVLLVVRGRGYMEDLKTLRPFIAGEKPVIIAVDGAADGCLRLGIKPHIVVGDMDSASKAALDEAKEIVLHAYPHGHAPGRQRLDEYGLPYKIFPAPGTSEDIALLLAHGGGADLIVAVGTHNNLIDFLDKGRPGMASTLLVRLKTGTSLIDARGAGKLYRQDVSVLAMSLLFLAAMFPLAAALSLSPVFRPLISLLTLRIRLLLGL